MRSSIRLTNRQPRSSGLVAVFPARCPADNAPTPAVGTVEKINPPARFADEPEKAEIAIEGADPLYKEIRIENTLRDEEGNEVALIPSAEVEVTIEAEPHQTTPKETTATGKSQN